AAPIMQGARYDGRAIYFSDVVVRHDSAFRAFADLRGAAWACNEPGSHSGYALTRCHLARQRQPHGFFSHMIEAGAHQVALRMVLDGPVAASAIDSTVLELELLREPPLSPLIRIIETLGPSPIPPAVVSTRLPVRLRRKLRRALLEMDQDEPGRR